MNTIAQNIKDDNPLIAEAQAKAKANVAIRDALVQKLLEKVTSMKLELDNASPKFIEAQLAAFATLDSLLNSTDTSLARAASLSLKQKAVDSESATAAIVVSALKKSLAAKKGTETNISDPSVEEAITDVYARQCKPLSDGELILDDTDKIEREKEIKIDDPEE